MPTEIGREKPIFKHIEQEARKAFKGATVLRVQEIDLHQGLVLVNTKRDWGHFALLEFSVSTGALHTGHYFDKMSEAIQDFKARGGSI